MSTITSSARTNATDRVGSQPPAAAPAVVTNAGEASDRVRERAYEIYQARTRSGEAGDAASDWAQAEHECRGASGPCSLAKIVELKALARGEQLLAGGGE